MDATDGRILRAPMRRKRNDEQLCDRVSIEFKFVFILKRFIFIDSD